MPTLHETDWTYIRPPRFNATPAPRTFVRQMEVSRGVQVNTYEQRSDGTTYMVGSYIDLGNGDHEYLPIPCDPVPARLAAELVAEADGDLSTGLASDADNEAVREWMRRQKEKTEARAAKARTHWRIHVERDGSVAFRNDEYGFPSKAEAHESLLKDYLRAQREDVRNINYNMQELAKHRTVVNNMKALNPETALAIRQETG